jgi:hypothetical protein
MIVSNPAFSLLFLLLGAAACTGEQSLKGTSANACLLTESRWGNHGRIPPFWTHQPTGTTL